jgi:hypothetical protein
MEQITFEELKVLFLAKHMNQTYFNTGVPCGDPDYRILAIQSGIHAIVHGTEDSFVINPEDYICMNFETFEFSVRPKESFEKAYTMSFPVRD